MQGTNFSAVKQLTDSAGVIGNLVLNDGKEIRKGSFLYSKASYCDTNREKSFVTQELTDRILSFTVYACDSD